MMEIEVPDENQEGTVGIRENGFLLVPVSPEESGEGLPYAPENWPNPGDTWGWRVGKRVSQAGHFLDRYLYLPKHLPRCDSSGGKGAFAFASKLSIERYIQTTFPGADINAFFASFSWKIPAKGRSIANGNNLMNLSIEERLELEQSLCDSNSDTMGCKAGNKLCSSLVEQVVNSPTAVMVCDICCNEPRFCRDCCCILCCKTVDYTHGGYSYIRCEADAGEGRICGHIAHINCALRSYMAGKVGGSIGLDAEYYCRRCDAKTQLVPHVTRLLQTCKSIDSRDDIEKILKVGLSILRGSERTIAKRLLNRIELAIEKLNCGTSLEDIWKVEDNALSTDVTGHENAAKKDVNHPEPMDVLTDSPKLPVSFDWQNESLKLEEEVDHVLQALRKSQETEYKLAEERLYAQKDYLSGLYQQLDIERTELTRHITSTNQDDLLTAVLNRVDQIKQELVKFKDMKKVASGFGKTSRDILEEYFDLQLEG